MERSKGLPQTSHQGVMVEVRVILRWKKETDLCSCGRVNALWLINHPDKIESSVRRGLGLTKKDIVTVEDIHDE